MVADAQVHSFAALQLRSLLALLLPFTHSFGSSSRECPHVLFSLLPQQHDAPLHALTLQEVTSCVQATGIATHNLSIITVGNKKKLWDKTVAAQLEQVPLSAATAVSRFPVTEPTSVSDNVQS